MPPMARRHQGPHTIAGTTTDPPLVDATQLHLREELSPLTGLLGEDRFQNREARMGCQIVSNGVCV
jgi:hypothetical protein